MNAAELPDSAPGNGAGPAPSTGLVIGSPEDLIAAVPYLLGFHPSPLSLVMIGTHGPSDPCTMRADLASDADPDRLLALGKRLASVITTNDYATVLLVGYGPDDLIGPALATVAAAALAVGANVKEAVRVHEGRWWSYLCDDPTCCPPEGTPYDAANTAVAAQATYNGHLPLADRAELAASVAPLTSANDTATQAALSRLRNWTAQDGDPIRARATLLASAIELFQELAERTRAGSNPADAEIAWLGVLLTDIRIRDEAWVRIDADHPDHDVALWREVVRRVDPHYVAAPASLLAYAAYMGGDGGLANVALDRALAADPHYSMANLLRDVIAAGVPPSKARVQLTPEDLAAAYDAQDQSPVQQPKPDDQHGGATC